MASPQQDVLGPLGNTFVAGGQDYAALYKRSEDSEGVVEKIKVEVSLTRLLLTENKEQRLKDVPSATRGRGSASFTNPREQSFTKDFQYNKFSFENNEFSANVDQSIRVQVDQEVRVPWGPMPPCDNLGAVNLALDENDEILFKGFCDDGFGEINAKELLEWIEITLLKEPLEASWVAFQQLNRIATRYNEPLTNEIGRLGECKKAVEQYRDETREKLRSLKGELQRITDWQSDKAFRSDYFYFENIRDWLKGRINFEIDDLNKCKETRKKLINDRDRMTQEQQKCEEELGKLIRYHFGGLMNLDDLLDAYKKRAKQEQQEAAEHLEKLQESLDQKRENLKTLDKDRKYVGHIVALRQVAKNQPGEDDNRIDTFHRVKTTWEVERMKICNRPQYKNLGLNRTDLDAHTDWDGDGTNVGYNLEQWLEQHKVDLTQEIEQLVLDEKRAEEKLRGAQELVAKLEYVTKLRETIEMLCKQLIENEQSLQATDGDLRTYQEKLGVSLAMEDDTHVRFIWCQTLLEEWKRSKEMIERLVELIQWLEEALKRIDEGTKKLREMVTGQATDCLLNNTIPNQGDGYPRGADVMRNIFVHMVQTVRGSKSGRAQLVQLEELVRPRGAEWVYSHISGFSRSYQKRIEKQHTQFGAFKRKITALDDVGKRYNVKDIQVAIQNGLYIRLEFENAEDATKYKSVQADELKEQYTNAFVKMSPDDEHIWRRLSVATDSEPPRYVYQHREPAQESGEPMEVKELDRPHTPPPNQDGERLSRADIAPSTPVPASSPEPVDDDGGSKKRPAEDAEADEEEPAKKPELMEQKEPEEHTEATDLNAAEEKMQTDEQGAEKREAEEVAGADAEEVAGGDGAVAEEEGAAEELDLSGEPLEEEEAAEEVVFEAAEPEEDGSGSGADEES